MTLSIIVVNYRGWKKLRLCLESLRCLTLAPFSWEVIIIDNQSADGQFPIFKADFPDYIFLENTGNFGFAHGCNFGARRASGKHFLFLNPDTTVTLPALHGLLTLSESHPEFTILSCQQFADNGKDTRPFGLSLNLHVLTGPLRAINRRYGKPLANAVLNSGERVVFPDWVSGSLILISKEAFLRLGCWDENFWMYYEDADLCRRAWSTGGKVALVSDLSIIHNHGGSSRINRKVKALTKSEVMISRHVYIAKYFHGFREFIMQSYLIFNNLLLGQLLMAIVGLLFFFVPSLNVYLWLYVNIVKYYFGALVNGTWISRRSVNYPKHYSVVGITK